MELLEYFLLVAVGFIAGFINTVAGGGTLLSMPMLIFMGLPPTVANGTNRVAIILQTFIGVLGFRSKGVKTYPFSIYMGIMAFLGAFIGAYIASQMPEDSFKKVLSAIMIFVIVAMSITSKQKFNFPKHRTKGLYFYISLVVYFLFGIYGGFINAGMGFIMLLTVPLLNRFSIAETNATKVMVVCIYSLSAILTFALNDKINWKIGLILAVGNISGAWIASRWSVGKSEKYIRAFIFTMVILMAIKLWVF
ncbi:MAG: integrase [Flavobacteriales bacterium]|nr:MAG: integrase [Flavobacteriales bacterium]